MDGGTHQAAGIVGGVGASFALSLTPTQGAVVTCVALVGSLFPDADHADSTISNSVFGLPLLPLTLLRHRGPGTHSLFAAAVWSVAAAVAVGHWASLLLAPWIGLGLLLGICSHLLLDLPWPGIPLFWPLIRRRVHVGAAPVRRRRSRR